MSARVDTFQLHGLGRIQLAAASKRASRLGLTLDTYLVRLVEEDLSLSEQAKTTTFDELMGPGRAVDEHELDKLVEAAKQKHHRRTARKKR